MFIRRTQTRNRVSGEPYVTHRLVHSARVGHVIKQSTLLNLGSHLDLPQAHWPALAKRIDELLHGQCSMPDASLPEQVQTLAQRFAAQIIARTPNLDLACSALSDAPATALPASKLPFETDAVDRYQEVDLDSLELVNPRSVGVEHAALSAMRQCGFEDKLAQLGLNRPQIAAAVGNVVARMALPCSELATHAWLKDQSALGELLEFDFQAMDLNRLYRASDALYKHREALQEHLFGRACAMFGLGQTITLYDLTNTYFEGGAAAVDKAKRGRSKERRSDCPLVTLAMALDASGFVRRVQFFAGNASEPSTLKDMLTGLDAAPRATVVMDAGISTEANLQWLRDQGYHYVVVSKLRRRQFDPAQATEVQSAGGVTIKLQRVLDAQGHVLLYCHSPAREQKDRAIDEAKASGLEAALARLHASLNKPKGRRDAVTIMQRLGRLKQRFARAAQHYEIGVTTDPEDQRITAITWDKRTKPGSAAAYPGVYCLRTTLVEQDNAALWRTYTMLTELESVFRSLKTDLGLRPVFHRIDRRVEGHLFISVLAYHFVHMLRSQLKAQGVSDSWNTLRQTLSTQRRVTVTMQRRDGRTVHVRKATRPQPGHQTLGSILKLDPNPGRTHRVLV
ncbi:IS1634 family transposase [Verminephrobacter aporrectodeae subsp. tuberculatae]|uniref:IS1634 family transposase n=1 Tax=Verminephrobacter aporrectodeae TaxID=1110389 RepID=UPI00223789CD|nr:IS1634 family transposase [Verminephrobacter aporrectodeae]MCW5258442.1 IS1634 family transposase [Verminephrobacter aporrectodeae subsp. tuberculatae]